MSDRKRPIDQLLDVVVYAPIGFVLTFDELLPQLVEKGHQQVAMARMFGQFAVDNGTKAVRQRVERMTERPAPPTSPTPASPPSAPSSRSQGAARTVDAEPTPPPSSAPADGDDVPSSIELPITDYDSLSASQVVPRLEGLSPEERDAVRRYESAHRRRKTILAKLAQLG